MIAQYSCSNFFNVIYIYIYISKESYYSTSTKKSKFNILFFKCVDAIDLFEWIQSLKFLNKFGAINYINKNI